MLVLVLGIAVTVGLLRGGRLSGLGQQPLWGWTLYLPALLLQASLTSQESFGSFGWRVEAGVVYPLSFLLLIIGSFLDRRTRGMWGVSAGLIMNLGVIVLNGGRMPVRVGPGSFRWNDGQALTHVPMAHSAKLWFLGDLIRISFYGSHALFLSPGDLLVAYGVFVVVQNLMLTKHEQAKNHAVSGG